MCALFRDQWKYADSLDTISNTKRILYLNSTNGEANDVFHSGRLKEEKPGTAKPDQYVYDPLDVRPAELEKEEIKNYITDEREALNLFGDGVVYHSQAFTEATEISGFVKLVVWMSLDVPDTDFSVKLYEIMPDGKSIQLTGDAMRARYRDSPTMAKLVKPGEINRYEFNGFTFFSREVGQGTGCGWCSLRRTASTWRRTTTAGAWWRKNPGKMRIRHTSRCITIAIIRVPWNCRWRRS